MTQIHNPVTGKNYDVRLRSSKYGKKGKIEGLWGSSQEKTEMNEKGGENNGDD